MAVIILSCGNEAAFIWNVMREMPPSASLCRATFAAFANLFLRGCRE